MLSIATPKIFVKTVAITKMMIARTKVGLYGLITIPPNNNYGNSEIERQKNIDMVNVIMILAILFIKSPNPTTYITIEGLLDIISSDFFAAWKKPSPVILI